MPAVFFGDSSIRAKCPEMTAGPSFRRKCAVKKIYVGNLSFNMSDHDLSALFAEHGAVNSATIVTDRDTGRSRGFGFVEMSSTEEANNAIAEFNGTEFGGRDLVVNEAKPRVDRGGGGGGGGYGGGGGRRNNRW
jgi:cold-inducible RNA-binding protein